MKLKSFNYFICLILIIFLNSPILSEEKIDIWKNKKEYKRLCSRVLKYATEEFSHDKIVDAWHDSMISTIEKFKKQKQKNSWQLYEY